jgi:hypothetical protein
MSEYSRRALELLRLVDTHFRRELHRLHEKIDRIGDPSSAIQGLRSDVEELAAQQSTNHNQLMTKLDEVLAWVQQQARTLSVTYTMEDGTTETSQGGLLMKITDIQSVTARAAEKDAKGNPVSLDASKLQWASADPSKVSATPNPDGSCTFAAVGPLTADSTGNDPGVQVSVSDGSLTQVDSIQVVSSAATSIGISFDQPADTGAAGGSSAGTGTGTTPISTPGQ